MKAKLPAAQQRAQDPGFIATFSLQAIRDRLPFSWPTPPHTPPSPKRRYRSNYRYRGWKDLLKPTVWKQFTPFDLLLRLIDFSGLEPVLAQMLYKPSARGRTPFHPVSLFLLHGWQRVNGWTRAQVLRNLRLPRYADYAQRFGFRDGVYPTEGGLRYFETTIGQSALNDLLVQSMHLIYQAGFLSQEALQKAVICPDGMIHDAASRLRCTKAQASCYQPTSPDAPRPCPAKEEGRRGCDCDTLACATACCRATPRDPQARYVWYSASNPNDSPHPRSEGSQLTPQGKGRFGYRSLAFQLCDPRWRVDWVLLSAFQPANEHEEGPAAELLRTLTQRYPWLHLHAVAGDAGLGYDVFLNTIYDLKARRVVDLRAHPTDRDKSQWPIRGYDDKGRPICPFGYALRSNGHDDQLRRHKWACFQTCQQGAEPAVILPHVSYPPQDCRYATPHRPHGLIRNVARTFPDRSLRLVRDVPYASLAWKRIYYRARNAAEGRNSTLEGWGLKRLPVFGQPRGRATVMLADLWRNLTTMARLVKEATMACQRSPTLRAQAFKGET